MDSTTSYFGERNLQSQLEMELDPSFLDLPYDVQLKILMCLDVRDQKRMQRVCTAWKDILSSTTVASQVILDFGFLPGGGARRYDALDVERVISAETRRVMVYGVPDNFGENGDVSVVTDAPPLKYIRFTERDWQKLKQGGKNVDTLVLEMVEVDMSCLMNNLPAALCTLVLRSVCITDVSCLYGNKEHACYLDLSVPYFAVAIPMVEEHSEILRKSMQEMIDAFVQPLSQEERMDLEAIRNECFAFIDFWGGMDDIIKGWQPEVTTVDFKNCVPPLDDLKPVTLRHLLEKSKQCRRWLAEDDDDSDWDEDDDDNDWDDPDSEDYGNDWGWSSESDY